MNRIYHPNSGFVLKHGPSTFQTLLEMSQLLERYARQADFTPTTPGGRTTPEVIEDAKKLIWRSLMANGLSIDHDPPMSLPKD